MLKLIFSPDFDPIMCDENGKETNDVTTPPLIHCKNRGP